MTCPGTYPTVLNGQISYNDSSTAEYACLTGFYMTGNKRITCSSGVWQSTPSCNVIDQADDVFPDWWLIVAAVVLVLLVLACLLCILCYYCCGRSNTMVQPYGPNGYNNGNRCCGESGCCRSGCCRSGCCGQNGCCSCSGGCGTACCGATSGCCLLGGKGGCCLCCRGSGAKGKNGQGKKGGAAKGKAGDWADNSTTTVVTTPPRSKVATTKVATTKVADKGDETQANNAHYIFVPADGDRHTTKASPPHTTHHHLMSPQHSPPHSVYVHNTSPHGHAHHSNSHHGHAHYTTSPHGHAHHATSPHTYAHYDSQSPPVVFSNAAQAPPCSCCPPNGVRGGGGWVLVRDAMTEQKLRQSEAVELEVLETRSDGDIRHDGPAKPKKQAKPIKGWIPHSNPVRSINTSTK